MNNPDVLVGVVAHKTYEMPVDSAYLPIWVGNPSNVPEGFSSDATGDNIHEKNSTYCELTGLYWLWKNRKADYMGLAHYRRLFSKDGSNNRDAVLSGKELVDALGDSDVLVSPKRIYPFSSVESHYIHSKKGYEVIHEADIKALREGVDASFPRLSDAFEEVLCSNHAHMLNIFLMRNDIFEAYCTWLFEVIDEVVDRRADRIDRRRFAGALSEFLLDVFIIGNGLAYSEAKLFEPETSCMRKCATKMLSFLPVRQ